MKSEYRDNNVLYGLWFHMYGMAIMNIGFVIVVSTGRTWRGLVSQR